MLIKSNPRSVRLCLGLGSVDPRLVMTRPAKTRGPSRPFAISKFRIENIPNQMIWFGLRLYRTKPKINTHGCQERVKERSYTSFCHL